MSAAGESQQAQAESRVTNDPGQLARVIQNVFLKRAPLLRDEFGEGSVELQEYRDGVLFAKHGRPEARVRLLFLLHGDHLLVLECGVDERMATGVEKLRPRKLHLRPPRRAERMPISSEQGENVFATGCVPVDAIPEALNHMNRKRDRVLEVYGKALGERLPSGSTVDFRLRRTQRLDPHMRAMQLAHRPIFAPHTSDTTFWALMDPATFVPFEQYAEVRRYEDDKELRSEIAVPLWYRDLFLYGYVYVRATEPLTLPAFQVASAIAGRVHEEFTKHGCLPQSNARCTLLDISRTGAGILYPHRSGYHKAFMPGAEVLIDLKLGEAGDISCLGVLKNIRSLEHAHRFGIEFAPLSPAQEELLTVFLEKRQAAQRAS